MKKKAKITSTSEMVRIMQSAGIEHQPPECVPLEAQDWPFFQSVLAEFARSEWTDHQLQLAAMLARCMSDLEFEQRELRREGSTVINARGTPVVNPRKNVVQLHAQTILSFRRSLALHARANGVEPRDVGKRREYAKQIEAVVNRAKEDDDGLLARPN